MLHAFCVFLHFHIPIESNLEYKFSLYDEKLAGSLSLNTLFINIIH